MQQKHTRLRSKLSSGTASHNAGCIRADLVKHTNIITDMTTRRVCKTHDIGTLDDGVAHATQMMVGKASKNDDANRLGEFRLSRERDLNESNFFLFRDSG